MIAHARRRIARNVEPVEVDIESLTAAAAFRFDKNQPRDHDGKWTDGFPGVGTLVKKTVASTKKVTPAVIYKKHDDGAVVGHSASGQRMRWDAGRKKFVVEKEKSGSWVEESAHTKTSAYNEMKNPDKWFEPAETGTENEPSSPSLTPEPDLADTDTTAETALPPQADIEMPDAAPPAEVAKPTKMGMSEDDAQKFISDWGANVDLSDDDRQAIKDWATPDMSAMRGMQTHLHEDSELTTDEIALRDKLDDVADRGKLTESVKAYRVVKPWADIEGDPTGKTITDRGFQSTSLAPDDVISMWGGVYAASGDNPVIFEMNVPEGTPAFTPEWNKSTFAHELTLGRDVDMKITGTRDETMFVPGLGKEHTFKVLTMDVTPRAKTDAPEILKQADAPAIESITPSTYVGPTATNYEGASKVATDALRQAYMAEIAHERRVDARGAELRDTDKETYTGWDAITKSVEVARAELAGDAPPEHELADALEMLSSSLPEYKSYEKARRRLNYEASLEVSFSTFAKEHGLGELTPEVKADLAKRTKDAFAGKKVAVRVSSKTVEHILSTGRIKSQFETNKSSGKKDIDMRASVETTLFGIDDKPWQNAEKRPIYGYVALDGIRPTGIGSAELGNPSTDQLTQYGNVQIVLKDSVRSRTTAMFGDSLNEMREGTPSPIDDPDYKSFTAGRGALTSKSLDGLDRSGETAHFRSNSYAEAQIHGGVGVDDIEEIVFSSTPTAALKQQLEDAGIPYRVLTFKTAADGSDEERANALRIAEQDKPLIEGEIAKLQEKLADPKYAGDEFYKKDLAKYEKQLKTINDALPALRGEKKSTKSKVAAAKEKVAKAIAPKQTKTHAVNPGGEDSFLDEDQKFDSWAARLTTRAKELAPVLAQFKQEDRGGGNSVWDVPSNGSDEDIMRKWLGAWQGSSNTPAVKDLARAAKELTGKDAPTGTYASSNPDVPKAIARAIYDQTQKQLADAGVSHVRLYRGLKTQDYTHDGSGTFESWTSDRSIAENFAMGEGVSGSTDHTKSGTVLTMDVPAADIFSTSKSGMGTDYEREYVVIPDKNLGPTIEVVSPKTVIPKQAEAPKIESTSTGTKLSAAEEQELTSLQAGIADLYGQSGYWRMLAAEVTHKDGTGKLLTPQDIKDSDQARSELKKLRDAATPLAERALELRMKRDGDLFGDVEDVNADRWASKAEPSAVMLPGNDKAKIDKIADSYRVNDKQTTEHNMSLRSDDPAQAALSWRSRMKRMINSQQMTRDAVVYRGAALTPERLMQLRPGTVMIDPGSMSTDESRGTAEFYMNVRLNDLPGTLATVFEIRAPKGIPVADVDFGEYVFDFETPMRIISTKHVNGIVNVVAELVPPAEAKALYGTAKPAKPKASSVPSVNLNAGKKGSISAKDAKRVHEINFAKNGIQPNSSPQEIFDKAKSTAYYNNWSIMQVLEAIDAMRPGYKKTVLDWLKTPEGSAYVDKKPSTS